MENACKKLIIALDDLDFDSALKMVELTKAYAQTFKIGLSLFIAHGAKIVNAIKALGVDVFLDLKLCDIPMQVEKAVEKALSFEPKFLTVHALGGPSMLRRALAMTKNSDTRLLCVTVLTSLDDKEFYELGFKKNIKESVIELSEMAFKVGITGFVSSPLEVSSLRQKFKEECFLVTPGVRPLGSDENDQSRVMTPAKAISLGANAVVIGRPITNAKNSSLASQYINEELSLLTTQAKEISVSL